MPDPRRQGEPGALSFVRRYVSAFGRFWWEFLVGDTPELLIGAVLAVGIAALLAHHGAVRAVTVGALPVLVIAMLGLSVRRAQRGARAQRPPQA